MKKYEIALLYGSHTYDNVEVYEYDTMRDMQVALYSIMENHDNDLCKIELSILKQDEDGCNEDSYTFAEINIEQFIEGNKINDDEEEIRKIYAGNANGIFTNDDDVI